MTSSSSILEERSLWSFRVTSEPSKDRVSTRFAHWYVFPSNMLATGFSKDTSEKPGVSRSETKGSGAESVDGAREGHARNKKVGARPMCEMAGDVDYGVPDRDGCCCCCCCSQANGRRRPDSREGRATRVDVCKSCTAASGHRDRNEGRRRGVALP
jgi:hypothetical protein